MFRMFMGILIVASAVVIAISAIPFDTPTVTSATAVVRDGEMTQSLVVMND